MSSNYVVEYLCNMNVICYNQGQGKLVLYGKHYFMLYEIKNIKSFTLLFLV